MGYVLQDPVPQSHSFHSIWLRLGASACLHDIFPGPPLVLAVADPSSVHLIAAGCSDGHPTCTVDVATNHSGVGSLKRRGLAPRIERSVPPGSVLQTKSRLYARTELKKGVFLKAFQPKFGFGASLEPVGPIFSHLLLVVQLEPFQVHCPIHGYSSLSNHLSDVQGVKTAQIAANWANTMWLNAQLTQGQFWEDALSAQLCLPFISTKAQSQIFLGCLGCQNAHIGLQTGQKYVFEHHG